MICLKNFVFFKSHMGTPLDWSLFSLKKKSHFHLLLGQTRARKKSSSEFDTRYLIPKCFSPWSFLTHIKNPMGLEGYLWLESLFVGQKEAAWIDLALKLVSENQSKLAQRFFHNVSNDLTEKFFRCEKSCGNSNQLRFFSWDKFFKIDLALSEVIKNRA